MMALPQLRYPAAVALTLCNLLEPSVWHLHPQQLPLLILPAIDT